MERAKASRYLVTLFLSLIQVATAQTTNSPLASALYVFGDNSVDVGNNNYLNTLFKSNHKPYGRDWHGYSRPTGRFSNGKLFVDYLGKQVKLLLSIITT